MADFVFVIEIAGFQHGDSQFIIKRVSISPVREGTMATFTFETSFLLHHSDSAIRTRPIPHEYQQEPRILLVTKGTEKIRLLEELVPAEGFFKNLIVRDLADYGCPPASRLLVR